MRHHCLSVHNFISLPLSQDRHSVVKRGEGESPPSTSPDDANQTFKFSPGDGQALQVHRSSIQRLSLIHTIGVNRCLSLSFLPVSRSALSRGLTRSWSWSIPRVEGDRESGKFLSPLVSFPLLCFTFIAISCIETKQER